MAHPLDGAREKIKRAAQHIDTFDRESNRFERQAYSTRIEPDTNTGMLNLFVKDLDLGEPPIQLMLLAGECAYQLRSALDHVIYLLAKQARKQDRGFPIFKESDKYKTRAPAMIKGVSSRAEAIIERGQPFQKAGTPEHHPLWMLHELNNTDKHRVIPACSVFTSGATIDFGKGDIYIIDFQFTGQPPKDGAKLGSVPMPRRYDPEMKVNPETFSTVAFTQITRAKFEPVVGLLNEIWLYVNDLVEQFTEDF